MVMCVDPSKGLTESSLEIAKSKNDSSFFEEWFGMTGNQFALVWGAVIVGAGITMRYRMKK